MHDTIRFIAVLAVFSTLAGLPTLADEGRTPLYEPTTITMPGSYVVTRNIATASGPVLTITTEGVTVDLNGFELRSNDPTAPVVLFNAPPPEADHGDPYFNLFGGNIVGGLYGIQVIGGQRRNVHLHHLQIGGAMDAAVRVHDTGAFHADMVTVADALVGFDLMCPVGGICGPAIVEMANVHASRGVQCTGVACSVRRSSFVSLGGIIRLTNAPFSDVRGNKGKICGVCFNPQPEPPAHGARVINSPNAFFEGNNFQGDLTSNGNHHGISFDAMSHFGRVTDNLVSMFGDDGIQIMSDDTTVAHNSVVGVGGNGIVVDGMDNFLETNKVSGSGSFGVDFVGGDHVYRGNILLGNDGGAVNLPAAGTIRDAGGNEL